MRMFYTYLLSNRHHTVYYCGFTDDLERRVYEHRNGLLEGFTKKYNIKKLLYYEEFPSAEEAKYRERQIKKYKKAWKENLINSKNPTWRDLYDDFTLKLKNYSNTLIGTIPNKKGHLRGPSLPRGRRGAAIP